MGFIKRDLKKFVTISAEGELRIPSDESNPLAIRREHELKDGSGGKGVKYETVQDAYSGLIKKISFMDNGFLSLNVAFEKEEGEDEVVISMGVESSFGIDLMRKLPNIDYTKEVEFTPYSFLDDKLKDRRGITLRQVGAPDNKVRDYFFDRVTKQSINGMLNPEGDVDAYDKDDWRMYYMRVRKFLVRFTEQNIIPLVDSIASSRPVQPLGQLLVGASSLPDFSESKKESFVPQFNSMGTPYVNAAIKADLSLMRPQGVTQSQQEISPLEKVMGVFPNAKEVEPQAVNEFGIKKNEILF